VAIRLKSQKMAYIDSRLFPSRRLLVFSSGV
jgi:hypothetical protein